MRCAVSQVARARLRDRLVAPMRMRYWRISRRSDPPHRVAGILRYGGTCRCGDGNIRREQPSEPDLVIGITGQPAQALELERGPLIEVIDTHTGRERPVPVCGLFNETASQRRSQSAATRISN